VRAGHGWIFIFWLLATIERAARCPAGRRPRRSVLGSPSLPPATWTNMSDSSFMSPRGNVANQEPVSFRPGWASSVVCAAQAADSIPAYASMKPTA